MLLGRAAELAHLDEVLDRARRGRSYALVVRGEAGVGNEGRYPDLFQHSACPDEARASSATRRASSARDLIDSFR